MQIHKSNSESNQNMKKTHRILNQLMPVALFAAFLTVSHAQSFDPGNLIVLQVGDGSAALTSAGTAIYLDQYTTGGSFVNDLAIPSTGSSALVNSGTASSEGQLSLSANDQYLVLAGYNGAAGTAGVAGATSSSVPRGIATVDASGNYTLAATTSSYYNKNNIRGGTSDGNGNYWGAGTGSSSSGGTVYMGTGTPAQLTSANSLVIQDIAGNLFYSSKANTGIYEIPGTPTSGTVTPSLLISDSNPSGFAFNSSMTIAYVANTSGGIDRFDLVDGTWTLQYNLGSGTAMNGLVADFSGTDPLIYATTEDGTQLVEITDTGSGSTADLLATAGSNEAFRGLEFAPVPEPSVFALIGLSATAMLGFRRLRKNSTRSSR